MTREVEGEPRAAGTGRAVLWKSRALAIAASSIGVSVLAVWYVLWLFFPSFNTSHTPLEGVRHGPSELPVTPGLARRVVVVFIDGISFEVARSLEELMPLRREGVFRPLRVPYPSYTDPAITSLVTGLDPADSGMRLNGRLAGVVGMDTVTAAAADAKVPVRVRSRGWEGFDEHLRARGGDIKRSEFLPAAEILAATLRGPPSLEPMDGKSPAREVSFVYVVEADKAGHVYGAASREFAEAARFAASVVASYARTLDLEHDAIVVVSDHGHLPKGGHGGEEPEVRTAVFLAAGSFVRKGVELGERPLRDVASTLSILAGLRAPSSGLGRPMLDALTLDDEQRSFVLKAPFDQAARMLCALHASPRCSAIEPLTRRLRDADPEAWPAAEALLDDLTRERHEAIAAATRRAAERRIFVLAAALALVLAAFCVKRRRAALDVARLLPLITLHAAVYAAVLALLGYRASLSSLTTQLGFYKDAFIASVAAVALTILAARARRAGPLFPFAVIVGTIPPLALLAAWVGLDPKVVPPPTAGVLLLIGSPAILSACLLAALWSALPPQRAAAPREPD
jgi:hypothetical protein